MPKFKIQYEVHPSEADGYDGETVVLADTLGEALFGAGIVLTDIEGTSGIRLVAVYREVGWMRVGVPE